MPNSHTHKQQHASAMLHAYSFSKCAINAFNHKNPLAKPKCYINKNVSKTFPVSWFDPGKMQLKVKCVISAPLENHKQSSF